MDTVVDARPGHEQPDRNLANVLSKYFPDNYAGTMLEVGAAHPEAISVSFPFRGFGWKIMSVEPIPEFCDEYRKRGFQILQYAACSEDKGVTTFKVSPNRVCSSSLEIKKEASDVHFKAFGWTDAHFQTIQVQALTLNTILKNHHPEVDHIDLLIVDTEGWEMEVMQGFNLPFYNPKVVCLENVFAFPTYDKYMEGYGYKVDDQEKQDVIYLKS